ncbi:MAG: hypothetical protein H6759_05090 [Candidatus Nomurabacteria bacterium]|nr:MAG: hypothetical protein H6759_05090 [Candidatus Nomurabacteria bacterium]
MSKKNLQATPLCARELVALCLNVGKDAAVHVIALRGDATQFICEIPRLRKPALHETTQTASVMDEFSPAFDI